jgi:RNA polymerase sigma-70 factor (ECF subfamily)
MTSSHVVPSPRTASDLSAWALVAAAQAGDQSAFGQLYDRYVDVVFRFLLSRVGHRQVAEDLTSETFLKALRRIDSVSYQGRDVGAWFVTIARRLFLDHVKSSRYRLEMTTADMTDAGGTEHGPDVEVIARATAAVLLEAVAQLSEPQREAVTLRHLHGMSVEETAAAAGCSPQAVKARTHRGVRTLAEMRSVQRLALS